MVSRPLSVCIFSFLHLAVFTGFLCFARATNVTVLAADSSGAFRFDIGWLAYVFGGAGGAPSSSVCSAATSMRTFTDGTSFTFTFHGVSAQLVLASGPDHAPFSVLVDGTPTSDGDTFSTSAACGVAWRSGVLPMGQHSVTGVLRSVPGRYYLELLGIIYDSGLSLPTQPPSSKTPATSTHHDTSSSAVVGSFSSPSGHISTSTKQAPAPVTTSHQSESSTQTLRESSSLSPSNSPSSPAPPEPPISTRTTSSTSSTNPTSTARQPPMPSRRKAIVVAATVAAAVGIMFFVLAALLLWVWLRRRRHQRALAVRKSRPYPLDLDPPIAHQRDILKHIDLMLEFPSARVLVQGDVKRPLGFDSISRADVNLVATHTQDSVMPRSPPRVLVQAKNGRLGSLTRESSGRTLTAY